MPELPEVENISRRLNRSAAGKRLNDLQVRDERLLRNCTESELRTALIDHRLACIRRRGKYLLFQFASYTLVNHLRMSGRWLEEERDRTRIILKFGGGTSIYLDDLRRLGTLHLVKSEQLEEDSPVAKLGVEPLSDAFTTAALDRLCDTDREIKRLLMDQKRIAGIGNIYSCEALFRSGIHPERKARSLASEELENLNSSIRDTLQTAIEHEGTSFDQLYKTPAGRPGNFQHRLRVYDREGETCGTCGETIQRFKQGQRSTYYCPGCQKLEPDPV